MVGVGLLGWDTLLTEVRSNSLSPASEWTERKNLPSGEIKNIEGGGSWVMDTLFKMEIQAFDPSWGVCSWNWLGGSYHHTLTFVAVPTTPQMLFLKTFTWILLTWVLSLRLPRLCKWDLVQRDNSWVCLKYLCCPRLLRKTRQNKTPLSRTVCWMSLLSFYMVTSWIFTQRRAEAPD